MRLLQEEQILLLEKEESNPILNFIHDLTPQEFLKIAGNTFKSETITDLDLNLSDYMSIEEYMDSFIDWCYGITEDMPEQASIELKKVKSEKLSVMSTLFKYYQTTNEYSDPIKELLKDPSVLEDINGLSEEAESELEGEGAI